MATFGLFTSETVPVLYTVTYDGNGNTSGTVPVDSGGYEDGGTVTVKFNTGSLIKGSLFFAEWNTAFDGSGTSRPVLSTFSMGTANVVLYAVYSSHPTLVTNFTANPTYGPAPLTVDFTNYTIGAVIGQDWTFGDGSYSSEVSPIHDYLYGGEFTVRLNSYDGTTSDLESKYNYVRTLWDVDFDATPLSGDTPLNVFHNNTGYGAQSWEWSLYRDIPDDNYDSYTPYFVSTEENLTFDYTDAGIYSVVLEGHSPYTYSYQDHSEFEYISVGIIADFTSNIQGRITAGTEVDFQDLSTRSPTSWLWDFGDGTTSSLQNPSHTYIIENGSMDVALTPSKGSEYGYVIKDDYLSLSNMNWQNILDDFNWRIIVQIIPFNSDLYMVTNKYLESKIRKSSNDGSTWDTLLDATGYSIVEKNGTLYVPTAASSDGTAINNGGLYTSTDGLTWDRTSITFNSLP